MGSRRALSVAGGPRASECRRASRCLPVHARGQKLVCFRRLNTRGHAAGAQRGVLPSFPEPGILLFPSLKRKDKAGHQAPGTLAQEPCAAGAPGAGVAALAAPAAGPSAPGARRAQRARPAGSGPAERRGKAVRKGLFAPAAAHRRSCLESQVCSSYTLAPRVPGDEKPANCLSGILFFNLLVVLVFRLVQNKNINKERVICLNTGITYFCDTLTLFFKSIHLYFLPAVVSLHLW